MTPEAVLNFWFGDPDSPGAADEDRSGIWFKGGPEIDREIQAKFGELPARALAGELDAWREAPRSTLALVLILDQFPRNLYRGTADAFACDPYALQVALSAIDRGYDYRLEPVEAVFLYMPLEHAEDLDLQRRCVELLRKLVQTVPDEIKGRIESFESFAIRHYEIIKRFGRFPHRNAVLNRATTDEERLYLESGGDTF